MNIDNMVRAIAFRELKPGVQFGAAQLAVRKSVADTDMAALRAHYGDEADQTARRLKNMLPSDIPPPTDDLALLIDAVAFRNNLTSRADVWRLIGVTPNTGRGYFGRNSQAVTWPIWFTLMDAAGLRPNAPFGNKTRKI